MTFYCTCPRGVMDFFLLYRCHSMKLISNFENEEQIFSKHCFPYLRFHLGNYKVTSKNRRKNLHCLFLYCSTIQKACTETCASGTQPFTMSQKMLAHLSGPRQVFRVGGDCLTVCARAHNKTKAARKIAVKLP